MGAGAVVEAGLIAERLRGAARSWRNTGARNIMNVRIEERSVILTEGKRCVRPIGLVDGEI